MEYDSKIFIAGHEGMVGSAIKRNLEKKGFSNIVTSNHTDCNLIRQVEVENLFERIQPDYVIDAAARVGGILANNTYRAKFIYENMMIQNNIIHTSHEHAVKKLLFLGSSCIYPALAPQPMKEEYLLSDLLEKTNEPYAIAKISGIKMCENYFKEYGDNFISVMPTNLYGFNDNYELKNSHVLPALIRKFHEAKISGASTVEIWGTGSPKREFLHVDDMADACIYIMDNMDADQLYDGYGLSHINIGTGEDMTINELALLVSDIIGYTGKLSYDRLKPDGAPRKLLDVTRLHRIGWHHKIALHEGIKSTYEWFVNSASTRKK